MCFLLTVQFQSPSDVDADPPSDAEESSISPELSTGEPPSMEDASSVSVAPAAGTSVVPAPPVASGRVVGTAVLAASDAAPRTSSFPSAPPVRDVGRGVSKKRKSARESKVGYRDTKKKTRHAVESHVQGMSIERVTRLRSEIMYAQFDKRHEEMLLEDVAFLPTCCQRPHE